MVMIALVGVFMGGLMVGRTPEYLGKYHHGRGSQAHRLVRPADAGGGAAADRWALATDAGRPGLVTNGGPRGFTEILFAYASCMANNGQTMAGLNANSAFYNLTTAVAMLAGRLGPAALALSLAGRFAAQGRKSATIGTLPCDTPTFGVLALGSALLLGALNFLPAWLSVPWRNSCNLKPCCFRPKERLQFKQFLFRPPTPTRDVRHESDGQHQPHLRAWSLPPALRHQRRRLVT